jgi:hypothetical protein
MLAVLKKLSTLEAFASPHTALTIICTNRSHTDKPFDRDQYSRSTETAATDHFKAREKPESSTRSRRMHELAHTLFFTLCIVLLVKERQWVQEREAYESDKQERCSKAKSGQEKKDLRK